MEIISRAYNGNSDLVLMTRLLDDLRSTGQRIYPTATDIFEDLSDPDVQITARLWETGGRLIGFAYISQYQNMVDVFNETEPAAGPLETEMMGWMVQAAQQRNRARGVTLMLDASSLGDDLARRAFLERAGFARQEESSFLMGRPLDQPIPVPQLPRGFCIRPMGGIEELEAYVALHRASFGTENMTIPYRQSIISAPDYNPELDLVAAAPDGPWQRSVYARSSQMIRPGQVGGVRAGQTR